MEFNIVNYTPNRFNILISTIAFLVLSIILFSSVSAFNPNATKYELIKFWGSKGTGNGQFNRPHDLDFSNDEKDSVFCR